MQNRRPGTVCVVLLLKLCAHIPQDGDCDPGLRSHCLPSCECSASEAVLTPPEGQAQLASVIQLLLQCHPLLRQLQVKLLS